MSEQVLDRADRIAQFIRSGNADQVTLSDAMALAELMTQSFDGIFKSFDHRSHRELQDLSSAIAELRREVGRLQAEEMTSVRIPTAGRELDAIVDATEVATHGIMESLEVLMTADPEEIGVSAYRDVVGGECTKILEACSFQDITGQRVTNVVETLKHIEVRVRNFSSRIGFEEFTGPVCHEEVEREARKHELILHGPQMDGEGVSQDEIDAMLADM